MPLCNYLGLFRMVPQLFVDYGFQVIISNALVAVLTSATFAPLSSLMDCRRSTQSINGGRAAGFSLMLQMVLITLMSTVSLISLCTQSKICSMPPFEISNSWCGKGPDWGGQWAERADRRIPRRLQPPPCRAKSLRRAHAQHQRFGFGPGGSGVRARAVLNGKKKKEKVFRYQFSQKSPRALHLLNHGWWRLAVGGWRRLAVGSWQLAVGGGWWWLAAVGGW